MENTTPDPDDRDGQICTNCCAGIYMETSIHDDWDGVLHCNNKECNHEVKRYKSKDKPKPKPEPQKVAVSAKTQAVLDAYFTHADLLNREVSHEEMLAAALRAAADQLDHATSAHTLYAIADELEVSEGV
jgi:hypothetical protein